MSVFIVYNFFRQAKKEQIMAITMDFRLLAACGVGMEVVGVLNKYGHGLMHYE